MRTGPNRRYNEQFQKGVEARQNDVSISQCPYTADMDINGPYWAWLDGWRDEDARIKKEAALMDTTPKVAHDEENDVLLWV